MPSVVDQTPYNEYTGNGVVTVYPYEFDLLDADDLVVKVDGVVIPASDFTLSGVGDQSGGDVTFDTAPADLSAVLLSREIALQREIDYQTNGDLRSPTVNLDFNRLWQALQGFWARLTGALRAPYPEQLDELPPAADRALQLLGFDADGQPIAVAPTSGSAADLALRLADPTSASNGAAMVANSATLSYAAGTVGARLRERISISDYPYLAVGDGALTTTAGQPIGAGTGTDNAATIQAAHDAIVTSGEPAFLVIPPGIFRCDTGLRINAAFVTLAFEGGGLDFRNIGNKAGLQIYSTGQYKNRNWCVGSGAIYGPVAGTYPTSKGIFYQSNSGGVGTADIAETSASGLNVYHFAESVQVGNNAYINSHRDMNFWFSQRFFYCPSGLTNTGQRWSFDGCGFLNGVNGFYIEEPTINLELNNPVIVTTGGYAFAPEAGYITMNGGGIEVDASTGAQFIKNTNAGGGVKSTFVSTGANLLYKNSTTDPFIELNSLNTYVTIIGGHASVAAGSVFMTGTGSGMVALIGVLPDGALNPSSSNTLGAGFAYQILAQSTGISEQSGTHTTGGVSSRVTAGGSVPALSGDAVNSVVIDGTYTTLFTSVGCFLVIVRDGTAGGCALLIYDAGSGVVGSIYNNIAATVQFQHTGAALQARTTAGTATRTMTILVVKV